MVAVVVVVCACAHVGQKWMSGVLLGHSPPYILRKVLPVTEPGACT